MESQNVEQIEVYPSEGLPDDVITGMVEEGPRRPDRISDASSSRGSVSSLYDQQDNGKGMSLICVHTLNNTAHSNVLKRRYARRLKENSLNQEIVGHLTREVHEALNIPYMSLVTKVIYCSLKCLGFILLFVEYSLPAATSTLPYNGRNFFN